MANQLKTVEDIVTEYYEKIYKYCYWQIKDEFKAQDITHEIFLCFIEQCNKNVKINNINAYIYTIARNKCIDALKDKKNFWLELDDLEDINTNSLFDTVLNRITLEKAMEHLKDDEKEIMILKYSQCLTIKEIARIMNMTSFNVQYKVKISLKKLKKIIG